ncbi:MAG: hypothetical protein P8105_09360, partial [Dehalococcoidia bacterium]
MTDWCARSDELVEVRAQARNEYFGYDEPGDIHYLEGMGDINSRERRFMGWFMFNFELPDGRKPAEVAAAATLSGNELLSALDSIKGSRYVLAAV